MNLLLEVVPALALLTGALVALRWWVGRGGAGRPGAMRVTSRTAVGRATTVAVVEVDGRRFLVGGSEHDVALLAELAPRVEDDAAGVAELPGSPVGATAPRAAPHPFRFAVPRRGRATHGPRTGLLDQLRAMTVRSHVGGSSGVPPTS